MPNQTMVYSCSAPEQEYTMVWFGIFLYLLISSLKIRFCEQSVFAKSPLPLVLYPQFLKPTSFAIYREEEIRNFFSHEIISTAGSGSQLILEARWGRSWRTNL